MKNVSYEKGDRASGEKCNLRPWSSAHSRATLRTYSYSTRKERERRRWSVGYPVREGSIGGTRMREVRMGMEGRGRKDRDGEEGKK